MITLLFVFQALAMPTAEELVKQIDANMNYDTRTAMIKMTVTKRSRTKTYEMKSHGRGQTEAAVEFLSPPRERGRKMLKKDESIWIYLPNAEKTQKLSGHMLRQGMMGSDMSYQDLLEATQLSNSYTAKIIGEANIDGRLCIQLSLTAKSNTVAYAKRILWVDKEHIVPLKEELYAVSGKLIKEWTMRDIKDYDGRKFPTKMTVHDKLLSNSRTEIEFTDLQFQLQLEQEIFNKRWLER